MKTTSARATVGTGLCIAAALATSSLRAEMAAEMKPYTQEIAGTKVKFDMVPIQGGTFSMGSPNAEAGRGKDEGPQRQVKIRPFYIGKFEVTWDEYDLYAFSKGLASKKPEDIAKLSDLDKAADGVTRPTPPYTDMTFGYGHDKYAALCMTHHAAMEYCRWLSAKTGKNYRLATEAEWEYACRAGTKTAYSFGDDKAQLGDYAWTSENSDGKPHPIGQKKPNAWGLHDMHGNVLEWCLDEYKADFLEKTTDGAEGPVIKPIRQRYPHTTKGGSWNETAEKARSASRTPSDEDWSQQDPQLPKSIWWHTDATDVGFRVVCPLDEYENLKGVKSGTIKGED